MLCQGIIKNGYCVNNVRVQISTYVNFHCDSLNGMEVNLLQRHLGVSFIKMDSIAAGVGVSAGVGVYWCHTYGGCFLNTSCLFFFFFCKIRQSFIKKYFFLSRFFSICLFSS